ncbi:MAG: hypothetical protein MSH25_10275 [Desulfovibrio sp.]|uniref:hypothetical protein n=1 Tax=Desulfovibrio sp. TaxID=885 RepID=UPI0025BC0823|nr:hypothetical protein [Desulfovibrio sp.]MCI7569725.1 hypothetical protein [Desulfovibrio sp.]
MLFLSLSHAGCCGGVQPLPLLLSKLARMGESAADMVRAALPDRCRVSWIIFGHGLTVREARRG